MARGGGYIKRKGLCHERHVLNIKFGVGYGYKGLYIVMIK